MGRAGRRCTGERQPGVRAGLGPGTCASLVADPWSWLDPVVADYRPAAAQRSSGTPRAGAGEGDGAGAGTFPEFRITRPDGRCGGSCSAVPIRGDDGAVVRGLGIAEDVTERKWFEQLLQQARERLEQEVEQHQVERRQAQECGRVERPVRRVEHWLWDIFESLPDAMLIVNAAGEVVGLNQTACVLFGDLREGVVGRPMEILVPDTARPSHQGHMAAYFQSPRARAMGSGIELEVRRGRHDPAGGHQPFAVRHRDGPARGGRGARHQRPPVQQDLRDSQERFDLAVRGSDAGIWDWDLRTDTVFFSTAGKSMLGYAAYEIAHDFRRWSKPAPSRRPRCGPWRCSRCTWRAALPEYELEHRLRHKDGSYRWILARGVAVRDDHGKYYRMVGSLSTSPRGSRPRSAAPARGGARGRGETSSGCCRPTIRPTFPGLEIAGGRYPAEYTAGDYFDYLGFPDGSHGRDGGRRDQPRPGPGHRRGLVPLVHPVALGEPQRPVTDPRPAQHPGLPRDGGELLVSLVIARIHPVVPHPHLLQRRPPGRPRPRRREPGQGLPPRREPARGRPARADASTPSPEVALEPGDLVLLYTDGVTEAHPAGDANQFELERTLQVVRAHHDRPAAEIAERSTSPSAPTSAPTASRTTSRWSS